jgi:hypothetical protein
MNDSNSFSSSFAPSLSSMQSIKEGLVVMEVLMLGVTLLVALAMSMWLEAVREGKG